MTERIDASIQFHQPISQTERAQAEGVVGQYRGQGVTHKGDVMSLIADAAEELTFGASERVEKKLSKRKPGRAGALKTRAMERAEAYLKKLSETPELQKLKQFVEHLKKQGAMSPQQLMQEAKGFFKHTSHQFAGLLYAKKMLAEEGGSEKILSAVDSALDDCMKDLEPKLANGIDVFSSASGFSEKGRGEVQEIWDFYRELVLKYETLNEIYHSLVEHYGETEFTRAIGLLIKAVGNYLQSQDFSISPLELKRVIDDLYFLEVLGNLHTEASHILEKVESQYGIAPKISPLDLTTRVLTLKEEKWLRSEQVTKITDQAGVMEIDAQIYFLRELKEFVRLIPLKIYDDLANREKLIDTVQEALDAAIDLEEEELE
jgi:type III secretion protein W